MKQTEGKNKEESQQTNKINQIWHSSLAVPQMEFSSCNNKQLSNSHHYRQITPGLLPLSPLQTLSWRKSPSRALPVAGKAEGWPQSTPPLLSLRHPQQEPAHTVSSSPARAGIPQVPFQTISQDSGSHLSQISAPLFTEDRYSTSTDDDQEICDAEVSKISRQ